MEPNVLGLRAHATAGDELLVNNLSRRPVVILDRAGRPFIEIPTGESRSWHDERVVHRGDPPPPVPGAPETDARLVKNWTIPGRAGDQAFAITGFLGWVPPAETEDEDVSLVLLAVGALALVGLSLAGAFLLGRRANSPPAA